MRSALPISLICLVIYLPLLYFQRFEHLPLWLTYIKDLLCMPLILAASEWCIGLVYTSRIPYQLSVAKIWFGVLYTSLVFEYFLPKYNKAYTADLWDVAMYAMGALIFLWWRKPKQLAVAQ